MTKTAAKPRRHFATMLSSAMDQLDISSRELSKRLGISYEHARRLQTGEALPSKLLVEKTAAAVGVLVERLQLAVQRDRMLTKDSIQLIAETTSRSQRVNLFEPLINALNAKQVSTAYAMLKGLVKAVKAKRTVPLATPPMEDALKHVLPKKRAKKKAGAA